MEQAPIMVSVYDRINHFKNCIESLKENQFANKSHLFIAIDAPFKEEHKARNKMVVDYAKSIKGFKNLTITIRETNVGAVKNRTLARSEIFSKYDKLIMFEDDNVFSTDFLAFVNKGLDIYFEREDIFGINGYNYPIALPALYPDDVYIWCGISAWGVGIWKEKWNRVDWTLQALRSTLRSYKDIRQLNNIGQHYVPGLSSILETGKITGDTVICHHMYRNKMFSVFPVISRVRNIGHDGSGLHCGITDIYRKQAVFSGSVAAQMPPDIQSNPAINKILWEHFKIERKDRVKMEIKTVLRKTGIIQ